MHIHLFFDSLLSLFYLATWLYINLIYRVVYRHFFFIEILFLVDFNNQEDYERIKNCIDSALSQYSELQVRVSHFLFLMTICSYIYDNPNSSICSHMKEGESRFEIVNIVKAVQDTLKCRTYCISFLAMDTI